MIHLFFDPNRNEDSHDWQKPSFAVALTFSLVQSKLHDQYHFSHQKMFSCPQIGKLLLLFMWRGAVGQGVFSKKKKVIQKSNSIRWADKRRGKWMDIGQTDGWRTYRLTESPCLAAAYPTNFISTDDERFELILLNLYWFAGVGSQGGDPEASSFSNSQQANSLHHKRQNHLWHFFRQEAGEVF